MVEANADSDIQKYLTRAKRVGVIDYHTGLGPCGYAERLTVFPPEKPEFKRAAAWFGAAVTSTKSGTAASKDVSGDNISGSAALLPHAEFTGIGFEVEASRCCRFRRPSAPTPGSCLWRSAAGAGTTDQSSNPRRIRLRNRHVEKGWLGQSLLSCRQAIAGLSL